MIHEDAQKLQKEIITLLTKENNHIIVNFEKLSYLNSSGLGALITILTKSRNMGGDTIITNVPDSINELLLVSKLNTVFKIENSYSDAIHSLEKIKNN
jgi:anti-sigma B factor antagonist